MLQKPYLAQDRTLNISSKSGVRKHGVGTKEIFPKKKLAKSKELMKGFLRHSSDDSLTAFGVLA